jgi:hypothetical protein
MAALTSHRTISSQAVQEWAEGSTTTSVGDTDVARLLIAVSIGDGHLKSVSSATSLLCIGHSAKQLEYLQYKADLLNAALGSSNEVKERSVFNKQTGKTYGTCQWWTPSLPCLEGLRQLLYPGGKKLISPALLKYAGIMGLAFFYMDDGHLHLRYRRSKHTGEMQLRERETTLAVCDTADQCEVIREWVYSLTGADMKLKPHNTSPGKFILRCSGRMSAKLVESLKSWIPSCMEYKTDLRFSSCNRGKANWSEPQR